MNDEIADGNGQKCGRRPANRSYGHEPRGAAEPFPIAVGVVLVAHQSYENHFGDELRRQHPGDAKQDRQRQREIAGRPGGRIGVQEIEQICSKPDERAVREPGCDPTSEVATRAADGPSGNPSSGEEECADDRNGGQHSVAAAVFNPGRPEPRSEEDRKGDRGDNAPCQIVFGKRELTDVVRRWDWFVSGRQVRLALTTRRAMRRGEGLRDHQRGGADETDDDDKPPVVLATRDAHGYRGDKFEKQ